MRKLLQVGCLSLALLPFAVGCQPANQPTSSGSSATDDHGHDHDHDHEEIKSFAQGVGRLEKISDQVKVAFEKGSPDDAHGVLHDVGHLLESLPALAANQSDIDDAGRDAIKNAVESLFTSYGKLDESMHGGEKIEYSELAPTIQTALDTLKGYVK
jgi:hypothetical protein